MIKLFHNFSRMAKITFPWVNILGSSETKNTKKCNLLIRQIFQKYWSHSSFFQILLNHYAAVTVPNIHSTVYQILLILNILRKDLATQKFFFTIRRNGQLKTWFIFGYVAPTAAMCTVMFQQNSVLQITKTALNNLYTSSNIWSTCTSNMLGIILKQKNILTRALTGSHWIFNRFWTIPVTYWSPCLTISTCWNCPECFVTNDLSLSGDSRKKFKHCEFPFSWEFLTKQWQRQQKFVLNIAYYAQSDRKPMLVVPVENMFVSPLLLVLHPRTRQLCWFGACPSTPTHLVC